MIIVRYRAWVLPALLTLLAIVVLTAHATATPGSLKAKNGTATFCLDPRAQQALHAAGITMSAGAPAQLLTTGPQPCVTTHVEEGEISLGLTDATFPFHGAITFSRSTDGSQVTFSDIAVTFDLPSTVKAAVDGNTAAPVTMLTFTPRPGNIMTNGSYLLAHHVPLNLTADGANAFTAAFGASPVATGSPLFIGTVYVEADGFSLLVVGGLPIWSVRHDYP
jgi:hypothetical protein